MTPAEAKFAHALSTVCNGLQECARRLRSLPISSPSLDTRFDAIIPKIDRLGAMTVTTAKELGEAIALFNQLNVEFDDLTAEYQRLTFAMTDRLETDLKTKLEALWPQTHR